MLFFPALWRKATFDPSADQAGRMTFFVASICCFWPCSIHQREPAGLVPVYAMIVIRAGDQPNV